MTDYTMAMMAGRTADSLIGAEVALQDKMWGVSNDRADATAGQMIEAATAQLVLVRTCNQRMESGRQVLRAEVIEDVRQNIYPKDWSGFRDYGSDVANLVVAAAYLRSEIKRRIVAGESVYRSSRRPNQPYTGDQPNP